MQVFGLPRHVIRGAAVASRLSNASPSGSSLERRDAVERWVGARQDGLSAAEPWSSELYDRLAAVHRDAGDEAAARAAERRRDAEG